MIEILQYVKQNEDSLGFLYALPAADVSSVHRNIYELRAVHFEELNEESFFTISSTGITRITPKSSEFHPMEQFETDVLLTNHLRHMPLFSQFRQWKCFALWRKFITSRRYTRCSTQLLNNSYLLSDTLRPALLAIQSMCLDVVEMRLSVVEKAHVYSLDEFMSAQFAQIAKASDKLHDVRDAIVDIASRACAAVMEQTGFAGTTPHPCSLSFFPYACCFFIPSSLSLSLSVWISLCLFFFFSSSDPHTCVHQTKTSR